MYLDDLYRKMCIKVKNVFCNYVLKKKIRFVLPLVWAHIEGKLCPGKRRMLNESEGSFRTQ